MTSGSLHILKPAMLLVILRGPLPQPRALYEDLPVSLGSELQSSGLLCRPTWPKQPSLCKGASQKGMVVWRTAVHKWWSGVPSNSCQYHSEGHVNDMIPLLCIRTMGPCYGVALRNLKYVTTIWLISFYVAIICIYL